MLLHTVSDSLLGLLKFYDIDVICLSMTCYKNLEDRLSWCWYICIYIWIHYHWGSPWFVSENSLKKKVSLAFENCRCESIWLHFKSLTMQGISILEQCVFVCEIISGICHSVQTVLWHFILYCDIIKQPGRMRCFVYIPLPHVSGGRMFGGD